jgi:hypothetical protein
MSDVLPKFKLYLFMSVASIIISIGYSLMLMVYANEFNILVLLSGFGTGFVPFTTLITVAITVTYLPIEAIAFITILTSVISIIQTYLIVTILLNYFPTVDV